MREAWYVPYQASDLQAKRVLVLAPHPDDEVFGCGGTLSKLAARGAAIQVVIATQGPQAELRLAESTAAATILGYPAPLQWDFVDRGLEAARDALIDRVFQALEAFEPDLLLAPSSWEMHPDHRAACDAALQAGERYGAKHRPLTIALYEIGVPLSVNRLVDISPLRELKGRAMQCFASQLAEQRYAEQIAGLNRYRSYTLGLGITDAEAFHVVEATGPRGRVALPSVQDQALWRCEAALAQAEQAHAHQSERCAELQAALAQSEQARQGAEQMLETIYATRGWRWLTRLKSLLGRG
ncbi:MULTISPECIES: PIG-L deacetylase family protein [unclassified Halomonas]|uniref:PIG-L deacetylase family protein n=1 Tax=unclassified Halomonas TaxID=2609666 RepID=UPI00209CA29F|nr:MULTISPECIES: PIG-L deacetylase family protein [unclassified Halomonas]MCP1314108.1 PIG-L family deacetylase [Halomonas sp. 707D7]MCP1325141.1 PIG-L family deacetylase [Halomonas sp. 707D4]